MMKHKDYVGRVEYDDESGVFHGEVLGTSDVITFQGTSVQELHKAFKDSVDDYLQFCKERNEQPDKPFSGKLTLRVQPRVHRSLYVKARKANKSISEVAAEILERAD